MEGNHFYYIFFNKSKWFNNLFLVQIVNPFYTFKSKVYV
jgi:hypothetical protein